MTRCKIYVLNLIVSWSPGTHEYTEIKVLLLTVIWELSHQRQRLKNIVNVPQLMGLSSYLAGMTRKKAAFVFFWEEDNPQVQVFSRLVEKSLSSIKSCRERWECREESDDALWRGSSTLVMYSSAIIFSRST